MTKTVERQTALVTGASGGIGEALAHRFAKADYDLILAARSEDKLQAVAKALRAYGGAATVIVTDLQSTSAGAALEGAVKDLGLTVDVVVNNAGYGTTGGVLDTDLDDLLGMLDLNCRVLTELSWRFGRGIKARGRGGVINVASTAAFQPGPFMAGYYATKAYVLSFTEALNQELRGSGAHATALCPGPVATGFQARAAFDKSMGLTALPMQSAGAVAEAGYRGFIEQKAVVIPGLLNTIMAKSASFAPRPILLSMIEQLQKKRSGTHG
jgi:short-subunit dehydrogenase